MLTKKTLFFAIFLKYAQQIEQDNNYCPRCRPPLLPEYLRTQGLTSGTASADPECHYEV